MSSIDYGWCSRCGTYRFSSKGGMFSRTFSGKCVRCDTELRDTRNTPSTVNEIYTRSSSGADSVIIASDALTDTFHKHHSSDDFKSGGGSFGGAGASSSWSDSSSSYDSGSSDSGSSGGGE